jgi:PTH1 family peptidyl-tRNA hydrolase
MNLSGEAAGPLLRYFNVPLSNVLSVYDELDLALGRIRLLGRGSAGGHNGMKSLIAHFSSQDFPRLRIGIGPKPPQWDGADFVLSRFTREEQKELPDIVERAASGIRLFIEEGLERAMNRVNAAT